MFESSNGDFDIQKTHINNLGDYVITAGLTDNGILGKTNIKAKVFDEKTITVDMFGNAFYRQFKYKMVTHARVFSLKPIFELTDNQGLFIVNSLFFLKFCFGYENMCSWEKIKNNTIQLPITQDEKIDFDFMEDFIRELEEERIRELTAYLKVSGLIDYTLTQEEKDALEQFNNVQWGEVEIPKLFEVKNTHNILSSEIVENSGSIPYLCASSQNNGISSYISYKEELKEKGDCIFIGGKTFVVSYQENDFFSNDSHNLALYLKESVITKLQHLFLVACVNKSLSHKYTWGNSISSSKIKNDLINIPLTNETPDYSFMETFIRAVEKLVIKDVVLYADKKLDATKKVVASSN